MSYSMLPFPPGVRRITIKPEHREPKHRIWQHPGYFSEELGARSFDRDLLTWFVWDRSSGEVLAIYHSKPNVHGWIASEEHARSHINRSGNFNPFELDTVP